MRALIYTKGFKLSNATNKKFNQGDVINFFEIDADKIDNLSSAFPDVARLPIILIYALIMIAFYFKWTIYGAILLVIVGGFANYFVSKLFAKTQDNFMSKIDKRMNCFTEILNNIKVIKLNSYTSIFA